MIYSLIAINPYVCIWRDRYVYIYENMYIYGYIEIDMYIYTYMYIDIWMLAMEDQSEQRRVQFLFAKLF